MLKGSVNNQPKISKLVFAFKPLIDKNLLKKSSR